MHKWKPGASGALPLGVLHGIDCLGCCAGLMVGLIALGMMNLALVFTAALIIFAEKTLPVSHRIARPLGVLMVAGGVVLLGLATWGGMQSEINPGTESEPVMESEPGMDPMYGTLSTYRTIEKTANKPKLGPYYCTLRTPVCRAIAADLHSSGALRKRVECHENFL